MGARNFTRVLGYAKHPLSVAHAFADARFCRRTLSQRYVFRKLNVFCRCTLTLSYVVGGGGVMPFPDIVRAGIGST